MNLKLTLLLTISLLFGTGCFKSLGDQGSLPSLNGIPLNPVYNSDVDSYISSKGSCQGVGTLTFTYSSSLTPQNTVTVVCSGGQFQANLPVTQGKQNQVFNILISGQKSNLHAAITITVMYAPPHCCLYTANYSSDTLSIFKRNTMTGELMESSVSPMAMTPGSHPTGFYAHPSGKFLYVATSVDSILHGYSVDPSTGALTDVPGSPYTGFQVGGFGLSDIFAGDSQGKLLYMLGTTTVNAFSIGADGSLTPLAGSPYAIPGVTSPYELKLTPSGNGIYIVDNPGLSWQVIGMTVDPVTGIVGAAVPGSPYNYAGMGVNGLAIDPGGKFVYVAHEFYMEIFSINSIDGSLSMIGAPDSNFGVLLSWTILFSPTNPTAMIAVAGQQEMETDTIDPVTGAMTNGPWTNSRWQQSGAIDSQGKFLYTTAMENNAVDVYTVDPMGNLKATSLTYPVGNYPLGITIVNAPQ